jgi:hypothetical protein
MRFEARMALTAGLLLSGCAEVVVDDGSYCLSWRDVDAGGAAADAIPPALSCTVTAPNPHAGVVPPENAHGTLTYVCVPASDDGVCAPPSDAKASAARCLEYEQGDICGGRPGFGGSCTRQSIWSMCGPDPAASGGCCYYAYVVVMTILS